MKNRKELEKLMTDIVEETVEDYTSGKVKRGFENAIEKSCVYVGSKPNSFCAVGRCLSEDARSFVISNNLNSGCSAMTLFKSWDRSVYSKGKSLFNDPRYEDIPQLFWARLQEIHDGESNWDIDESDEDKLVLTELGQNKVSYLIKDIPNILIDAGIS